MNTYQIITAKQTLLIWWEKETKQQKSIKNKDCNKSCNMETKAKEIIEWNEQYVAALGPRLMMHLWMTAP